MRGNREAVMTFGTWAGFCGVNTIRFHSKSFPDPKLISKPTGMLVALK
jgi:hypothetical protein